MSRFIPFTEYLNFVLSKSKKTTSYSPLTLKENIYTLKDDITPLQYKTEYEELRKIQLEILLRLFKFIYPIAPVSEKDYDKKYEEEREFKNDWIKKIIYALYDCDLSIDVFQYHFSMKDLLDIRDRLVREHHYSRALKVKQEVLFYAWDVFRFKLGILMAKKQYENKAMFDDPIITTEDIEVLLKEVVKFIS